MKAKNKLIYGYEVKTNIYGFTVVSITTLEKYCKYWGCSVDDDNNTISIDICHENYPDYVESIEVYFERLLKDEYYKVLISEDRDSITIVAVPKSFIYFEE